MPFAKVTFDFQNEAHRLLSWLKLAANTIQNKPFDRRSVQSLLIYKVRESITEWRLSFLITALQFKVLYSEILGIYWYFCLTGAKL